MDAVFWSTTVEGKEREKTKLILHWRLNSRGAALGQGVAHGGKGKKKIKKKKKEQKDKQMGGDDVMCLNICVLRIELYRPQQKKPGGAFHSKAAFSLSPIAVCQKKTKKNGEFCPTMMPPFETSKG